MKYPDFRRLFMGRLFLNLGDSLVYMICMWYLYQITQDSLYTGIASFLFALPALLGIFWGPVVDTWNQRRLLGNLSALLFLALCILSFATNWLGFNLWLLLLAIPVLATASEFLYPVGEALLPRMVAPEELTKANSWLMMSSTGADLFFNAISALVLSLLSLNQLFGLTSILFFFAFFFFKRIRTSNPSNNIGQPKRDRRTAYIRDLKEGLSFVRQPLVLRLLFPLLLMNCVYAVFYVSLPEFTSVYYQTPTVYGLLLMLLGLGSMFGSLLSEFVSLRLPLGYLVAISYSITGLTWLLAVISLELEIFSLTIVLILLSGVSNGIVNVAYSVLFQKLPPHDMIGRVHTINMTLLNSLAPLASLVGGLFVRSLGSLTTILICGASLLLISLSLLLSQRFRTLPKMEDIPTLEK